MQAICQASYVAYLMCVSRANDNCPLGNLIRCIYCLLF